MDEQISVLLKEYGLNDKEIALYKGLVGKDRLTAYALAKETRIHRSTVYDTLRNLIGKGFASSVQEGTTTYYFASSPSRLMTDLKSKEALLQRITEEIKNLSNISKTTVQYLEGVESQKQFNIDALDSIKSGKNKEVLVLGNGPSWTIGSELLIDNIISELKISRKVLKYRAIWDPKFKNKNIALRFEKLGEQRYLKLPSLTTTVIMDDMVALLFTTDSPKVVKINEPKVAKEMKAYFEHIWTIAHK